MSHNSQTVKILISKRDTLGKRNEVIPSSARTHFLVLGQSMLDFIHTQLAQNRLTCGSNSILIQWSLLHAYSVWTLLLEQEHKNFVENKVFIRLPADTEIYSQQGRDGKDGLPGRDGKDFASLNILRDIVNETVVKGRYCVFSCKMHDDWALISPLNRCIVMEPL